MSGADTVRVLRGRADERELAAVLAVLHALAARAEAVRAEAATHPSASGPSASGPGAAARPRAGWRRPHQRPRTGTWRTPPAGPMSLR
ncbi:acyl-CoA carboxylase epsilon subunit [Streptomyces sp. NPDC127190]|uniref:acyl-CoA carboxylase epsilon subunit n=1 Tax=unclassified Streptomyces TaxID=2593676 RepID=UPI003640AFB5